MPTIWFWNKVYYVKLGGLKWITDNWSFILWEREKLNLMLLGTNYLYYKWKVIVRFDYVIVFKVLMSSQDLRMYRDIADKLITTTGQVCTDFTSGDAMCATIILQSLKQLTALPTR